ncbi:MAG: ABC transporter permease [Clostridia bacterium]|nr:ABC transporter permease [Clostridia bacterium]
MTKRSARQALINAPYMLWAGIFIVVPLFIVMYYAFTDSTGAFSFANILALADYAEVFRVSIIFSVIATIITLLIGYPFAYCLTKLPVRAQRMQMMLVMLPMWMNLLIRTYSWMNILEKNGLINTVLSGLGLPTANMIGTPGAVILGMVYNYLPYMILPIYTTMAKIDPSLSEAAEDLGCNAWQKMRRLIVPMSIPGVVSGITMVFVPSISTFYISQKLGGGKILLIGDIIERQIQVSYNYNLGASLSFVLMVLILISMAIMNRFSNGEGEMVV